MQRGENKLLKFRVRFKVSYRWPKIW